MSVQTAADSLPEDQLWWETAAGTQNCPQSQNLSDLKQFLGLVGYGAKFIQELQQHKVKTTFQRLKSASASVPVFSFYLVIRTTVLPNLYSDCLFVVLVRTKSGERPEWATRMDGKIRVQHVSNSSAKSISAAVSVFWRVEFIKFVRVSFESNT